MQKIFALLLILFSIPGLRVVYAGNDAPVIITFLLHAPAAKKIEVIGNFNGWESDSTQLKGPDAAGNWRATIAIPDDVRTIRYLYLVDGKTVVLDPAYPAVNDDFGGKNNLRMIP